MREERIECTMLNLCRVVVLEYYHSIQIESELLNDPYGSSTVGIGRGKRQRAWSDRRPGSDFRVLPLW